MMQKDCIIMKIDQVWFKVFDKALSILVQKIDERGQMATDVLFKIQTVQAGEMGLRNLALERFGSVQGVVEEAEDRDWL